MGGQRGYRLDQIERCCGTCKVSSRDRAPHQAWPTKKQDLTRGAIEHANLYLSTARTQGDGGGLGSSRTRLARGAYCRHVLAGAIHLDKSSAAAVGSGMSASSC